MAHFTSSLMIASFLMWILSGTLCSSLDTSISNEDYCHDTLAYADQHQHDIPPMSIASDIHLGFHGAFFSGGSPLFGSNLTAFSLQRPKNSASLSISSVKLTDDPDAQKYVVEGSLLLRNRSRLWSGAIFNRTRVFRQVGSRRDPFLWPGGIRLTLKGLWVARAGTLCMSGCFMQGAFGQTQSRDDCKLRAVFHYQAKSSISQPLVKGIIESMREKTDPLFFEHLAITGVSEAAYEFRKDDVGAENWPLQYGNVPKDIKIWNDETAVCRFPWYKQPLMVMWDKQCTRQDCSPFEGGTPGSLTTLSVENMVCTNRKIRGLLVFSHHPKSSQAVYDVLSVEGFWNTSTGQLCASACYLKGAANESLAVESQDCDILITLQFPTTLSLVFRYSVVGRVERKKASSFSSFKPFLFTGHMDITYGSFGWGRSPPQLEYTYTEAWMMQAYDHCKTNSPKSSKKGWMGKEKFRYPDGHVFQDFGFQASLKDSAGSSVEAYFSPVAINGRTNMLFNPSMGVVTSAVTTEQMTTSMNISFDINFYTNEKSVWLLQNITAPLRFPAEGVYKSETGLLCLSACRMLTPSKAKVASKLYDDDKDCQMLVTIQYPPINPGYFGKHEITGKVMSLREQTDALFFSLVSISSSPIFYQEQAQEALVQVDFEIIMGIISLTMAVLFIGLQLHHVKKNPKVLSQMSLLMLIVLTTGHLIPLVLNFEAIFSSRTRQNVLQWSSGWLEINEVIVRVMTMLVFLMLIRLLYLSWVSKSERSPTEGPWHMEQGALRVCFTLYALGGLIAMIIIGIKGSNFLDVMKAFAGLIVDFFLFPQVVGNYFWEVQGVVLSFPFYVGIALVRSLPHLYDILRKLEFFSLGDRRYYYANPSWDFYSKAWDAIIPVGNLLLAVLVYCQQRYGGACFSIGSWRKKRAYIQVSMNPI